MLRRGVEDDVASLNSSEFRRDLLVCESLLSEAFQ